MRYGVLEGDLDDANITPLAGDPFGSRDTTVRTLPLDEVDLLPPVCPSKVIGFGLNYANPETSVRAANEEPMLFVKPPSAVVGLHDSILLPQGIGEIFYEAELAVVIGSHCRDVSPSQAHDCVLGYTCANDVTAMELPQIAGVAPMAKAKSYDTFCPIGPWIETDIDPADLAIVCRVNGVERQSARTSGLRTTVPHLVALTSTVMTLCPGDVILTGTPSGIGALHDGDEVEVWVESIGSLTNPVRLHKPPPALSHTRDAAS